MELNNALFIYLYIYDLSSQLKTCNTGCMIGTECANYLLYADELVVLSLSSAVLQQLLTVCSVYGALMNLYEKKNYKENSCTVSPSAEKNAISDSCVKTQFLESLHHH